MFEKLKCAIKREMYLPKLIQRGLKVGKNFKMMGGCILDPAHCWHISIGDDVTLAPRVHILAHDASTKIHLGYTKVANTKIGNRCFVGAGSIILPGVTIGDDVIVGAGSIVSKDIPSGMLAVGNPAKVICSVEEYVDRMKGEINSENTFGEDYTLRNSNFSQEQRNRMVEVASKQKLIFVK
ncbi:MAG: acyltransferase [Bacteroidales bacterium]|nr:acyltransferase [Bacteroidales bacterium]